MLYALKRLLPGLGLIFLAALALLIADRAHQSSSRDSLPRKSAPAVAAPVPVPAPAKGWKIELLDYADSLNVEETHDGLFAEFKVLGFTEGREYTLTRHSAHGDMAVLNGIIDTAVTARPDLIITTSTPTLQVAVNKVKTIPVVFTTVADGVQAGAGESDVKHLPNITGVTCMSDFGGMVAVVKNHFPRVKRIGTLFVPSEINSVRYKEELEKAAARAGLTLETVGIATTAEVADAALALADRQVDIITQISDNTTGSAFPAISAAARKARIPLFGFVSGTIKAGAAVVVARDYREAGQNAARLVARIMKGESPARIPFTPLSRTVIVVSTKNAGLYGMTIPPSLRERTDKVVD